MARATIEDVAKRAGVTKSTVSHALSGKRPVSAETRRRVDEAIAALSYRPNPVARRLAAGRSGAIGFVYPLSGEANEWAATVVLAAASAAVSDAGFAFVLFARAGSDPGELQLYLESGLLDGVVVGQVQMIDPRILALCDAGGPFVLMGRTADNGGLKFVDVDIEGAVEECVEHLVGLGHGRIAFLYEGASSSAHASRALQAYERACARGRLRIQALSCPATAAGARGVASGLLRQHPDTTALIVKGDLATWGARQAALGLGRRVPEDLSLVCLGRTAVSDEPGLEATGVDLLQAEQARQAVGMLVRLLGDSAEGETQVLLEPRWVNGGTTAPAA